MAESTERRLAAIMFTDIVGSTVATARSETTGLELRDRHRRLVRAQVGRYRGRFVEAPGDESLSVFDSALNAVNCALAIQRELESDPDLALHVGVHLGEIVFWRGGVRGRGQRRFAHLQPRSPRRDLRFECGGGCASGSAEHRELARAEHGLRGVERPVSVSVVSGTLLSLLQLLESVGEGRRFVGSRSAPSQWSWRSRVSPGGTADLTQQLHPSPRSRSFPSTT